MDIAIIPAKSYSRRLKNKNIKLFNRKPIIVYPLIEAIKSKCFDKIFISTDSKKIRDISIKFGADYYKLRNKKYVKNYITINELMCYETKRLLKIYPNLKRVCCILPTAVFFKFKHLKFSKKKLVDNKNIKFCFISSKIKKNLPNYFYFKENKIKIINKLFLNKNSEFFPDLYIDSGQFYYSRVKSWIKKEDIYENNCYPINIPINKIVDINDINDFNRAKKIFKKN